MKIKKIFTLSEEELIKAVTDYIEKETGKENSFYDLRIIDIKNGKLEAHIIGED